MIVPINKISAQVPILSGDLYVADYTNQTNSVRKLEILSTPPTDIAYFYLHNRQCIQIYCVNFEKYPAYTKVSQMCECMFTPVSANNKPWVLLMEMKYCEYGNVDANAMSAFLKLKHSYAYLHSTKKLIDPEKQKIYLAISIPNHSILEPFNSFRTTQTDSLDYYNNLGIIVFARNNVLAATPNHLIEIKKNYHN